MKTRETKSEEVPLPEILVSCVVFFLHEHINSFATPIIPCFSKVEKKHVSIDLLHPPRSFLQVFPPPLVIPTFRMLVLT
jgi:hypothetical protein